MALKNLKDLDKRLKDICKNQPAAPAPAVPAEPYVDRTELLLEQMSFIAAYNKQLLKIA